jgi:hypothetical protein
VTRTVYSIDRSTGEEIQLATFELRGDQVVAEYRDDDYRRHVEDVGILIVVDGQERTLTPRDGRVFFDHLERALWQSQTTFVRTEVA